MGFLDWLFGKKGETVTSTPRPEPVPAAAPLQPAMAVRPERPQAPSAEADNLRRWKDSGRPRAWVEAHKGRWNHDDWLALLEELRRSPFWPLQPDQVGLVLEDVKREWLRRN
jgi:hypothetical protein